MKLGKRALLICLIGFILMLGAIAKIGAEQLATGSSAGRFFRIVSYNIRYDNPMDGENVWAKRKSMVASMIRFHHADIFGVQEALKNQIDDLEKLLPEFNWHGVGRDDGKAKGEFSAIFYRKDRFQPLEGSTFWLSETPDVPGSKSWDAAITRIVTWAEFKDKATDKIFFHFNTHFDHRGVRAREESARLLLSRIEKIAGPSPVVVTGDFNFNESSPGYKILTGAAEAAGSQQTLSDARYLSLNGHHGPTTTFNSFKSPGAAESKIDFILVKGTVKVLQHGVLSDVWDGRLPSEHFPVLAEV